MAGCYSSHWDSWGLLPNHRYTLEGGSGNDRENGSGKDYCLSDADGYARITNMEDEVAVAMDGWMESPGHRAMILRPDSTLLHIGIAADAFNVNMVQQFSSDYVTYTSRPSIAPGGLLTLSGSTSGATPGLEGFASVSIYHDAPPHPLTVGQLTATYAVCKGRQVAYLRKPGRDVVIKTKTESPGCVDPYRVSPDRQAPQTYDDAGAAWQEAKAASEAAEAVTYQYKGIPAERMDFTGNAFNISADLSAILDEHGPGVYRILLWGTPDHMGKNAVLSEQSVFWHASPPAGAPYGVHLPGSAPSSTATPRPTPTVPPPWVDVPTPTIEVPQPEQLPSWLRPSPTPTARPTAAPTATATSIPPTATPASSLSLAEQAAIAAGTRCSGLASLKVLEWGTYPRIDASGRLSMSGEIEPDAPRLKDARRAVGGNRHPLFTFYALEQGTNERGNFSSVGRLWPRDVESRLSGRGSPNVFAEIYDVTERSFDVTVTLPSSILAYEQLYVTVWSELVETVDRATGSVAAVGACKVWR